MFSVLPIYAHLYCNLYSMYARTTATYGRACDCYVDPYVHVDCHVCLSIAMYVPVDCHVCVCWLPCMCMLIATSGPLVCLNNCHIWATSVPVHCHMCASWLPFLYLLIATCGPVVNQNNCHTRATSVPVECHALVSWLPFMYLLIATFGPVVCHICPSCLPHVGQTTATCEPHVGRRCKTRVAHMCALSGSYFNCHMWALCGPLVECLLGLSHATLQSHTK